MTEGNYYLIAYNGKKIVHHRIDRMRGVAEMPDAPREGHKEFEKIDLRTYTKYDDNHFTVSAEVEVSNMFYSWVCGFRKKATIVGPPEVVDGFQQFLSDILQKYN